MDIFPKLEMQSLARSIVGLCRRRAGSAPPRLRPLAYAREDWSLVAVASAYRVQLDLRLRPWILQNKTLSSTAKIENVEKKAEKKVASAVAYQNPCTVGRLYHQSIIPNSTHRDGAIYNNMVLKKDYFGVDLTDHNETRSELLVLPKDILCIQQDMLQFFSLTLAECHVSSGPVELYGYIAARDDMDWMCNYIFNRCRNDPIIVQQGSLIEMTGPKRAIEISSPVLIEFDIRIKNGAQEKDDQQLIDGAFGCYDSSTYPPLKHRINGDGGTVDMCFTCIEHAVEATVEIVISEVHSGFTLSVSSFIKVIEDYEEIQLFHGSVDQPMRFRRFVVAVSLRTVMLLKFYLASYNVERCYSFNPQLHGDGMEKIDFDLASVASVSVKVTWSSVIAGF